MANRTDEVPKLLRVSEVARLTGIHKWRLYELLANGRGPRHMRIGRTIRIAQDEVVKWIEEQHASTTNEADRVV